MDPRADEPVIADLEAALASRPLSERGAGLAGVGKRRAKTLFGAEPSGAIVTGTVGAVDMHARPGTRKTR
jgi:hypothetical protein